MKDKTEKQSASKIALQDIVLHLVFYIYQPKLLSLGDPLLSIFESVVDNKPEMDDQKVKKDWNCLTCKVYSWDHAKFCKTIDSQIWLDLLKGFQIFGIVYILR